MTFKLILYSMIGGLVFWAAQAPYPIVRVFHGVLQGSWKVSTKGRSYASFEGIPYARPPIGKYRFREPQPLQPWIGIWNATRPLSACLQYNPIQNNVTGSENCLYLNVHTPRLQRGAMMPVMIYIHGGAFMFGQGSDYGAANIMDWDMVVVTIEYRLGPLGFLSTGDDVIPGNYGLKDQSFALHWIKNNIMMFGGNPESITLTGSSAGSASVHYHYLSPLSRGMFSRGIAYSGSAFSSWTHSIKPAEKARTLASIVGCPTGSSRKMLHCLKYRPAEAIARAQENMFGWRVHLFTPFTPVVEARGVREPFLQQYPYYATINGYMMKVPLITSVTSAEGLYPAAAYQRDRSILPDLEVHWDELAPIIFEYNDTVPVSRRPEVAQAIKQHYLGGKPVSQGTFPQLVEALGDRLFYVDVGKLAQIHATKSGQPTYTCKYAYRGSFSVSDMLSQSDVNYGVAHSDDVMSIFKSPGLQVTTAEHAAMIDKLINVIYSYSTTGIPKLTPGCPEWLPVRPGASELDYLEISSPTKSEMKSSSDFGQKSFWDNLGLNENENYRSCVIN